MTIPEVTSISTGVSSNTFSPVLNEPKSADKEEITLEELLSYDLSPLPEDFVVIKKLAPDEIHDNSTFKKVVKVAAFFCLLGVSLLVVDDILSGRVSPVSGKVTKTPKPVSPVPCKITEKSTGLLFSETCTEQEILTATRAFAEKIVLLEEKQRQMKEEARLEYESIIREVNRTIEEKRERQAYQKQEAEAKLKEEIEEIERKVMEEQCLHHFPRFQDLYTKYCLNGEAKKPLRAECPKNAHRLEEILPHLHIESYTDRALVPDLNPYCEDHARVILHPRGKRFNDSLEPKEIQKNYHAISLETHPDRNPSEKANAAFEKIGEAYRTLTRKF